MPDVALEAFASGLGELERVDAEQQARRRLVGRRDSQHGGRGLVRVTRPVPAAVEAPGAQRLEQLVVVGDHTGCADHRAADPVGPETARLDSGDMDAEIGDLLAERFKDALHCELAA
ncbi:hypothetical protein ACFYZB_34820 [Streptomyces sp. NPDC001852]|uniref:hypothetical protein n=1 Tax=Streptomyces sp. NPDC001852 TaxID=3364619 RepID=UPI0036AF4A2E